MSQRLGSTAQVSFDEQFFSPPRERLMCGSYQWAAYFENSYDSLGGVIDRPEFEARLRKHFGSSSPAEDGVAWYALRNTVYAAGLRIYLFESEQMKYAEAQAKAWRFFENALAVFVELVFAPSAIPAVQAVAAMVSEATCYSRSQLTLRRRFTWKR